VLKLQRRGSLGRSGRLQSALNEHRNILKALIKRDGTAAQEAMHAHLARGLEATR
jgi:DNA-binding GntR family transcriptional regulator